MERFNYVETAWALQRVLDKYKPFLEGSKCVLVAVRGFYLDMGVKGQNDRGIYDDCIFTVDVKTNIHSCRAANVDPSIYRQGIATIKDKQVVWYKLGKHGLSRPDGGYPALRQSRPLIVVRDNTSGPPTLCSPAWPYTNIHRGGDKNTSSLGCITLHPTVWDSFYKDVKEDIETNMMREIPCIVITREDLFLPPPVENPAPRSAKKENKTKLAKLLAFVRSIFKRG